MTTASCQGHVCLFCLYPFIILDALVFLSFMWLIPRVLRTTYPATKEAGQEKPFHAPQIPLRRGALRLGCRLDSGVTVTLEIPRSRRVVIVLQGLQLVVIVLQLV